MQKLAKMVKAIPMQYSASAVVRKVGKRDGENEGRKERKKGGREGLERRGEGGRKEERKKGRKTLTSGVWWACNQNIVIDIR